MKGPQAGVCGAGEHGAGLQCLPAHRVVPGLPQPPHRVGFAPVAEGRVGLFGTRGAFFPFVKPAGGDEAPAAAEPAALQALLRPFPAEAMGYYRVSTRVNAVRNDDAECIAPLAGGAEG